MGSASRMLHFKNSYPLWISYKYLLGWMARTKFSQRDAILFLCRVLVDSRKVCRYAIHCTKTASATSASRALHRHCWTPSVHQCPHYLCALVLWTSFYNFWSIAECRASGAIQPLIGHTTLLFLLHDIQPKSLIRWEIHGGCAGLRQKRIYRTPYLKAFDLTALPLVNP